MHKRHKKKTTLVKSNLGFQQWTSFFKNNPLTQALYTFQGSQLLDTFEEIGNKANAVRNIELKALLEQTGCIEDRLDKAKWHTPEGVISVTD